MLRALGIIFLVLIVLVGGGLIFGLSSSGTERDLARTFISHVSDRDFPSMRDMMHPELAKQFPIETLSRELGQVAVYDDVNFNGFNVGTNGTTINGSASTASGCTSPMTFTFRDDIIIAFTINPLCFDPTRPGLEQST
ncbi:hypothetical protein [Shimia ponticola]|uniref:hypothetical protein n=1 Tax=Shimia ponticola TaxID=2582893 RepID=UPI00164A3692|nr:hypothetical protein [Shimia ponticola]